MEQVRFANGLGLIMKKTPYQAGEVQVSLTFGRGLSSEPTDQPGLAALTEALLNEAGFGAMDRTDFGQGIGRSTGAG